VKTDKGEALYLNSGDWVENLTALEYSEKKWSLYHYKDEFGEEDIYEEDELNVKLPNMESLYQDIITSAISEAKR
jgi:hypothetical protein